MKYLDIIPSFLHRESQSQTQTISLLNSKYSEAPAGSHAAKTPFFLCSLFQMNLNITRNDPNHK